VLGNLHGDRATTYLVDHGDGGVVADESKLVARDVEGNVVNPARAVKPAW
jgi:hypothetical protein